MGSWLFVRPRLRELVEQTFPIRYIGRPESSSPAEGSLDKHNAQQASIVAAAFADVPPLPAARNGALPGTAARKNGASKKPATRVAATGE
jgi:hypothetical protein